MNIPQEHLPKDRPATDAESWGFTIWEFIAENWIYLLFIVIILIIFFYARFSWRKRHENEKNS